MSLAATQLIGFGARRAGSGGLTLDTVNNVFPTMTSNTAPSGTVSSSSDFSGSYPPWQAFDGGVTGPAPTGVWMCGTGTGGWIQYQFSSGIIIGRYKLQNYRSVDFGSNRSLKDWVLKGSNDGTSFTTLDTKSAQSSWGDVEERTFDIANTTSYTYYRWADLTSQDGSSIAPAIANIKAYKYV